MQAGVHNTLERTKRTQDRRSDQTKARNPVVYFLKVELGEYRSVKIGFSADGHKKRLNQHRSTGLGPRPNVTEICVIKAKRDDEKAIQNYFHQHLVEGCIEEFHPHPELLDYIRWLRDRHYVWVPDEDDGIPLEQLEVVDSEHWFPTPERRKPQQFELFLPSDPMVFPARVLTINDYYTDERIIAAARRALGEIDLDPASHAVANKTVKAKHFYTRLENGLNQEWNGKVWLNPPFGDWKEWVPKILTELKSGRIEAMCVLAACRTLTAGYLKPFKDATNCICILDGRIPFWGGKATSSPNDGHAIFYIGKDISAFKEAFTPLGNVWEAH